MLFRSSQSSPVIESLSERKNKGLKGWERWLAGAEPGLDVYGQPVLRIRVDDDFFEVGLTRANILSVSESPELAAGLLEARLHQEMRHSTGRKTSPSDVGRDLTLLQRLLGLQSREVAASPITANGTNATRTNASRSNASAGSQ